MEEKVSISKEFVIRAHDAACQEWKRLIEKEIPSLFNIEDDIRGMPEFEEYKNESDGVIEVNRHYIYIQLPNCNLYWTLSAWKLAEAICNKYEGYYPTHDHEKSRTNNIIIQRV